MVDFLMVDFLMVDFLMVDFLMVDFLMVDFLMVDFLKLPASEFYYFHIFDIILVDFESQQSLNGMKPILTCSSGVDTKHSKVWVVLNF